MTECRCIVFPHGYISNVGRLVAISVCALGGLALAPSMSSAAVSVSVTDAWRGSDTAAAAVVCKAKAPSCEVRLVARGADRKVVGKRVVTLKSGRKLNVGVGIDVSPSAPVELGVTARSGRQSATKVVELTAGPVPRGAAIGEVYRVQTSPSSRIIKLVAIRGTGCAQGVALDHLSQSGGSVSVSLRLGVPVAGQPEDQVCSMATTAFCVSVDLGKRLGGKVVVSGPLELAVPSLTGPSMQSGAARLVGADCPRVAVGAPALA